MVVHEKFFQRLKCFGNIPGGYFSWENEIKMDHPLYGQDVKENMKRQKKNHVSQPLEAVNWQLRDLHKKVFSRHPAQKVL